MGLLDLLLHFAGFLAPAAFVALLVSSFSRVLLPKSAGVRSWSVCLAIDFVAGTAALVAGLLLFGRDGKMPTYAALVLAVASAQWAAIRGWR